MGDPILRLPELPDQEVRRRLTDREYEYFLAARAVAPEEPQGFGYDGPLLGRSIRAKLEDVREDQAAAVVVPDVPDDLEARSVLDGVKTAEPFSRADILRGHRVLYRPMGSVFFVKGVDRSVSPPLICLMIAGRPVWVQREQVARLAPMEFDRRWRRKAKTARKVVFASDRIPRDSPGYDQEDD